MDTDILILQLRQCGVNVPAEVGQIAFIDTDSLYAILRQVLPLCGLATEAEVKKQFPAKLPTSSPSARYYVLNSFDVMLKKSSSDGGAGGKGGGADDDDDDGASTCPTNTEALMYPTEATTRALLSWVVSTIAHRQEKLNAAAAASSHADADDELVGVAPTIGRLLKGSLLALRAKVNDNAAVINAKSGNAATMQLLATPMTRTGRARRVVASASNDNTNNAGEDVMPAMIPVAPTLAPTADENAAAGLNQLNRMHKQASQLFGAPRLDPQRAKLFALAQAFATLQIAKKSNNAAASKKAAAAVLASLNAATTFELDEASVYGGQAGNTFGSKFQTAGGALGALFFDTDADGLDVAGNKNGGNNARARTQQKLDEANRDMSEIEDKTKSAAQRLEEREAELARVQEALSEAKKQNKLLKQLLADAEGEYNVAAEELKAFSAALDAKEEALQGRKDQLEKLTTQLGWMEDYEGTVATFEAQISEAKALQKQVQEDLHQKLTKMEAKKEELAEQVAVAGDGRQEQILAARNKVKKIKREIKAKTKEIEDLHREYDRVPKDIDRSLFLRFIFDMTNNIQRQQAEVDKVKTDLHKESLVITEKTEKLQQLFSSVEQEVYKKAVGGANGSSSSNSKASSSTPSSPDDEFAKDAFKRIVAIREAYANLRSAIQDRGDVRHEVHIMEEKNSKALRLGAAQDQKKVAADLEAVEKENDELTAKLDTYLASRAGKAGDEDDDEEEDGGAEE